MINPQIYKKALQNLKVIGKKEEKEEKIFEQEKYNVYDEFSKLEDNLRERKRKAEDKIRRKEEKFKYGISKEEEPYCKQVSEFKRVISFMGIIKDKDKNLNFEVYYYDYPKDKKGEKDYSKEREKIPYKEIATIKNDEYALIKVFITDNRKPKNKFSLIVVGKTIFNADVLKRRHYGYGIDCLSNGDNIKQTLKDMPTKEELLTYFEKHKSNILKEYLEEHKKAEQEYIEAIEKTKDNKKWEIAYYEDLKDYYENHYCRGTETKEYKEVIKKLKDLKK